jgi:NADP-dependent 3-hydroxy acid dehydrogenase YdfG
VRAVGRQLDGAVAVVTGASSGVGRATVRALAHRGASVALIARGRDGLEAARQEVESLGARALVLPLDVADADAVEEAAGAVEEHLGPIDVWVNNAMLSVFAPVHELHADEVRRVTEVTYLGYVHGTLAALRRMRPRDSGVIVQVGSALAYRSLPLQAAYCGAKHAIDGFSESLRCELLHDRSGVQVTRVQMPALNTPHFSVVRSRLDRKPQPVPPIFQPEVAAEAIVWAAEHPRRELYVALSTAQAIFGDRLAPGLADRYLARKGYELQQTDEPADPDRRDNLFEPVPGDRGAHGVFGDEAKPRSVELELKKRRRAFALGALVVAAAGTFLAVRD